MRQAVTLCVALALGGEAFVPTRGFIRSPVAQQQRPVSLQASSLEEQAASFLESVQESLEKLFTQGTPAASASPKGPRADQIVKQLFDTESQVVDPAAVAAACSEDCEWVDMSLSKPIIGKAAIESFLTGKFPAGTKLVAERIADGAGSSGFTWHREKEGVEGIGLRGTMFVSLNADGEIDYVQEGCEPLFKPGEATAKLLQEVTKNVEVEESEPTYTPRTPKNAKEVVEYLWLEAYPGGAKPDEALRLFSDSIRYEDFNYPDPFVGLEDVEAFVTEFDFPGIEFIAKRISDGSKGCCFTWSVKIGGADGPEGISFYECDDKGKVKFIRDIPAPSLLPPLLPPIANLLEPQLRVFKPLAAE